MLLSSDELDTIPKLAMEDISSDDFITARKALLAPKKPCTNSPYFMWAETSRSS